MTVKEMRAIACIYYNEQLPNGLKVVVADKLKSLYNDQPHRLPAAQDPTDRSTA